MLAHVFGLTGLREVALEYALGFAFGWMVFQVLFMREMFGGSYPRAIARTFIPELLSMNLLMAGMVPTMMILQMQLGRGADPTTAAFWFVMSMALLVGFIAAYPMNWWLVRYSLKHGMMTVRPAAAPVHSGRIAHAAMAETPHAMEATAPEVKPKPTVPVMTLLSFVVFAAGLVIASIAAPM